MSEFPVRYADQIWGTVVFREGSGDSDFLKDHRVPVGKNFYQDFYSESENPLKKSREIQYQHVWSALRKFQSKGNALDVGCGRGEFVDFLRSHGFASFGIEPALKHETAHLKRLGMEEAKTSGSIPSEYDLVSLMDVLEHFADSEGALGKVASLVSPGGYLLVKVPNKGAAFYRLGKALRRIFPRLSARIFWGLYQMAYPPPHYHYFSAQSLKQLLGTRFEVVYEGYISECPLGGLWSRFWMVPRVLRPLVVAGAVLYRAFSIGRWNDGIVMIARKR